MILPIPKLPKETLIVAVSGGRDSVALLHSLASSKERALFVCHINHGLRGEASNKDEEFVRSLAGKYSLPFQSYQLHLNPNTKQIETEARNGRLNSFAKLSQKIGTPHIILGQHADDQAETFLLQLLRGAHHPHGMSPRLEITNDGAPLTLWRPLLHLRRSELNDYLDYHKLTWQEDETNAEPFTPRNRLRKEAIPLLSEIMNRDIVPPLNRSAKTNRDEAEARKTLLAALQILDPQDRLYLPRLRKLPPVWQKKVLHQYLTQEAIPNLSSALVKRGLSILSPDAPPRLSLPGGHLLRRKEARLFIERG